MSPARLETFADGVFAIAATLLIIGVDQDVQGNTGHLAHDLLNAWPSFAAYVISFLTIGIIFSNHNLLMNQIDRVDRPLQMLTVGLLLCVSFLPLPTRLVAEHIRSHDLRPAAIVYGITMTTMALMFISIWLYSSRGMRLLKPHADPKVVSGITRSYLPGTPIYLAATLVALVSPLTSVILFGAIALFYALESTLFAARVHRRPAS